MTKKLLDYSDTIKMLFQKIEEISFQLDDQNFLNMVNDFIRVLEKYQYKKQ